MDHDVLEGARIYTEDMIERIGECEGLSRKLTVPKLAPWPKMSVVEQDEMWANIMQASTLYHVMMITKSMVVWLDSRTRVLFADVDRKMLDSGDLPDGPQASHIG